MNYLEKIEKRRAELQNRHTELQTARKTARGFAAHEMYVEMRRVGRMSSTLSKLIRKANHRSGNAVSARWFISAAECNVAGARSRAKVHAPKNDDAKSKKQGGPRASQRHRAH